LKGGWTVGGEERGAEKASQAVVAIGKLSVGLWIFEEWKTVIIVLVFGMLQKFSRLEFFQRDEKNSKLKTFCSNSKPQVTVD
jgi:hypothetical protein